MVAVGSERSGLGSAGGGARTGRGSARVDCQPEGEDTGVGGATARERARRRGGETPDEHPGGRVALRVGDTGLRAADGKLPTREGFLRLDRPRAPTTLHGRQNAGGQNIKDGPARHQAAFDHRGHGGSGLGGPARRAGGFMVGPDVGAQTSYAGRGGAGESNGAHRLGVDDEQGIPQGACAGHLSGRRVNIAGRNVSRSEDG